MALVALATLAKPTMCTVAAPAFQVCVHPRQPWNHIVVAHVQLSDSDPPIAQLSYAKQYCRYGMEVAMLANKTDAAFFHVATETVTSVALVLVSVATWKKPLS